ncbi:variably expressed lipoprotein and hemagglutinin (VlhA) family protein [Mycoplasmoides gallisepticum NC96_1596-4-2P]|uniref:FIVAR domain-containing protein n=1 Tax=Mycoplasmoides gallisepticum TaxID=2096 RepID=UPI0002778CE4|nr:FIVAR domain-containing protein [Mycoplasmoides gallisepticum]AFP76371.1 variably expressed lipoprotein and hemagglutinin (VlhA) family protein [Mycoplasmoides gallisepticum VA94_7994-1-7P]AFP77138.1 variably expressed lipoprotein and hemagglutinin (VlhA) family protein [Mycoplasmoides gallisepticum NC95_13295-2-2P]AFP77927.1 variably expressed lipoprotein and hemagglutinin (VlhA) family protein [Mycoplasmoides gallisepticum NC96_1596-4-2P]
MKRKNILKFVSLLGIGSFVMLAAASCTQASTPTPTPTPTPNPEPKPDPMTPPSGGDMNNPLSGGMNGGDTNPGNGGGTDNAVQQLAAARKTLTDLLGTENTNVALYADYAKIQSTLSTAYMTAKTASENTSATLDNLRSASTTLQAAIDKAASDKRAFDSANQPLVTAYNQLKTTLQSKTTSLEGLSENKYSSIKNHLSKLFDTGSAITAKTLDPTMGTVPEVLPVTKANEDITTAVSKLTEWKTNADKFNEFVKNPLSKGKLSAGADSAHNQEQPANWSFAGYSVDLTTGSTGNSQNPLNWNFAQRKVWTSEGQQTGKTALVSSPVSATDVSWIYSLAGEGTKYTLTFEYYGPDNAFLYFPYKLVKQADSSSVALQYSLNKTSSKLINFEPAETVSTNTDQSENEVATTSTTEARSSSEVLVADEAATSNNEMNPTPTVSDINIAKVTLSGLTFGENTIEFSVPTNKVAPMIGNMYLTSNSESQGKIYNEIFGNTSNSSDNSTSVTVDLLTGYSLASGWSTYIGEFKQLMDTQMGASSDSQTRKPSYLVGFIGGPGRRQLVNNSNKIESPKTNSQQRTFTIYVNAPQDGDYYISGSYLTSDNRQLMFSSPTGDSTSSMNNVTLTIQGKRNWTTLGAFNTQTNTNIVNPSNLSSGMQNAHTTLRLKKGLNKVVISGVSNGDTPYIGNLTFTLNNNPSSNTESETRQST